MIFDTSCEDCIFSVVLNNKQEGCYVKALSKFEQNGDEIYELTTNGITHKVIKGRVCMCRRHKDWEKGRDLMESINSVQQEILPQINFLVKHSSGDDLEKTLSSLGKLNSHIISGKGKVIVSYNARNPKEIKILTHKYIEPKNSYFCCVLENRPDIDSLFDEGFRLVSNGYTCILESGKEVDPWVFEKINCLVNNKMKRLALIEGLGDHMKVISNVLFKNMGGDSGGSFKSKIEDNLAKNMIFTWKEVNEYFTNLQTN